MNRYFHLTIGPVQGFVAQARRTRDFWAGSFILSFLSAVAMRAVEELGGEILFPKADPRFLRSLVEPPSDGGPSQGGVPNRFKASVSEDFDPRRIIDTIQKAWRSLTELIWQTDLAQVVAAGSYETSREIWERQIREFWEVVWAMTPDLSDSAILDRRKNWRSHIPPAEAGTKCMIMDGWQELSGAPRPGDHIQERFWRDVRSHCGYDLREGEHLCALAFVKRRFARHFRSFEARMPGGWILHGWKIPTAVPSVAYMAAAPWLAEALRKVDRPLLQSFQRPARKLARDHGEWDVDLQCLLDAEAGNRAAWFRSLPGDLFFEETLDNEKLYPDRALAEEAKKALQEIRKKIGVAPSPFYATLAMDGDSLGQHMSDVERQPAISAALERFTTGVQRIVNQRSGFLVYAGGDDVLALLPLDQALGCALDLRQLYRACFDPSGVDSTLSGAIELAHFRVPLTRVLGDAHELLDEVAKEDRGRDALAVRVWTPGGKTLEWAMPWEVALERSSDDATDQLALEALASDFVQQDPNDTFSSGFFYRLRELFELLNPRKRGDQGLSVSEAIDLMTAEYMASGLHEGKKPSLEKAKPLVGRLLEQCRPVRRRVDRDRRPPRTELHTSGRLEADGGLLVRFLARKGVDS